MWSIDYGVCKWHCSGVKLGIPNALERIRSCIYFRCTENTESAWRLIYITLTTSLPCLIAPIVDVGVKIPESELFLPKLLLWVKCDFFRGSRLEYRRFVYKSTIGSINDDRFVLSVIYINHQPDSVFARHRFYIQLQILSRALGIPSFTPEHLHTP